MNRIRLPFALAVAIALSSTTGLAALRPAAVISTRPAIADQSYSGTLESRRHFVLTLRLRDGRLLLVDATQAYLRRQVTQPLAAGQSLLAQGNLVGGVLIATSVRRS